MRGNREPDECGRGVTGWGLSWIIIQEIRSFRVEMGINGQSRVMCCDDNLI